MKNNKMIYLLILILLCDLLYSIAVFAQPRFSTILIAHGSTDTAHNQKFINLKNRITDPYLSSLEVAFLGNSNQGKMDTALGQLRRSGTTNILLIPLSPCSYIRHDEIETIARGRANALGINTFQFRLAPAMDDHPVAADILKDHARNLSRNPQNECLLIFAYGPVEEIENIAWLRRLEQMGDMIKTEVGFEEVACATVRNHSADLIAEQSIIDLRRKARDLKEKGRVIVVPYVFEDGPYEELQSYLKGIVPPGDIVNDGFISNARTENWVRDVISRGMTQPVVREINRHWSTQTGPKGNF